MYGANPSNLGHLIGKFAIALAIAVTGIAVTDQASAATCTISPQTPSINIGGTVTWSASYTGFSRSPSYSWTFQGGNPGSSTSRTRTVSYANAGTYTTTLTLSRYGTTATCTTTVQVGGQQQSGKSINSTSQSCGEASDALAPPGCLTTPVAEQPRGGTGNHTVLAINDLGMHCGDLDTRIASILPPFQVMLAQIIQKGDEPTLLGPGQADIFYSAASNPNDPILSQTNPDPFSGVTDNGDIYKTNFWNVIAAYDPFYPPGVLCSNPANPATCVSPPDKGLPVPNVENLYIGPDGAVNSGDEFLSAVQHAMPGISGPYLSNVPQLAEEHYTDKPFFVNFPFGYVANAVDWFEAAGIPFAAYDDAGRENAYPLVRVQAKTKSGSLLASVDTVLPISGEASCKNCHASTFDVPVTPDTPNAGLATQPLAEANLPIVTQLDDDEAGRLPMNVSIEYATDINILRLHDLENGPNYVNGAGQATPCSITAATPNGNANCLTNKALNQGQSVVCQTCHYTPALDLAQFGPLGGIANSTDPNDALANGRVQKIHASNSSVIHHFHGTLDSSGRSPGEPGYNANSLLYPKMPAPVQNSSGVVTNQSARLDVLEQTCYLCHPGRNTKCLRGAMFNGGMLCNDCHGNMQQVGNDFSLGVSPSNPGDFKLGIGNFYDPNSGQPRVPWANEPGCGSCHTGDATSNLANTGNVIKNIKDIYNNTDNIRLIQAWKIGDAKATPIVPTNKRFAENVVPASFNGFTNPGAGNPKLYRVSTGHGGVMCEGCHGATHAEWPNANPNANDNIAANQLQGHTGTIIECTTCHSNGFNPSGNEALGGPHGMHVVGNTSFSNGGHEDLAEHNPNSCRTCHGQTGQGSVLSVAKVNRTLSREDHGTVTINKGQPVACNLCHENPLN